MIVLLCLLLSSISFGFKTYISFKSTCNLISSSKQLSSTSRLYLTKEESEIIQLFDEKRQSVVCVG